MCSGLSNRCVRAATRIARQFRACGFCVRQTQLDASRWVAKTSSAGPTSELVRQTALCSALQKCSRSKSGSERLQEFNEIGFMSPGEFQLELPIVVIDHLQKVRRTSIVKIRRMLPESS